MNKTFEKPELEIVLFEGDLDTYDVLNTSGEVVDPWSPGDKD